MTGLEVSLHKELDLTLFSNEFWFHLIRNVNNQNIWIWPPVNLHTLHKVTLQLVKAEVQYIMSNQRIWNTLGLTIQKDSLMSFKLNNHNALQFLDGYLKKTACHNNLRKLQDYITEAASHSFVDIVNHHFFLRTYLIVNLPVALENFTRSRMSTL